jgi:hypothetical protein
MSLTDLGELPAVIDLVTAGRVLGLGRTKSYERVRGSRRQQRWGGGFRGGAGSPQSRRPRRRTSADDGARLAVVSCSAPAQPHRGVRQPRGPGGVLIVRSGPAGVRALGLEW